MLMAEELCDVGAMDAASSGDKLPSGWTIIISQFFLAREEAAGEKCSDRK